MRVGVGLVAVGVGGSGVDVEVGVADGVRLGVEVRVGVIVEVEVGVVAGWAVTVNVHPLPSVTVRPKAFVGTMPGQAASALRKSKLNTSASPMLKSSVMPRLPGLAHVVGEEGSSVASIVLASYRQRSRIWLGLAAS